MLIEVRTMNSIQLEHLYHYDQFLLPLYELLLQGTKTIPEIQQSLYVAVKGKEKSWGGGFNSVI